MILTVHYHVFLVPRKERKERIFFFSDGRGYYLGPTERTERTEMVASFPFFPSFPWDIKYVGRSERASGFSKRESHRLLFLL